MSNLSIRCVIMRGGTSKAVFLNEADLPPEGEARDRLILKIFGSPDRRQIDGLGGGDPLTSKVAILGSPPPGVAADVAYTFGQVELEHPGVDYRSLCGNISAAVGAYAIREGYVRAEGPITPVRAYSTNLDRILTIEIPTANGRPLETGRYSVPGVPGTGARILIDFADTAGAATGALLPTGRPRDLLDVPGVGAIEATLIDIGNAHVFIRARAVGLSGVETPAGIDGDRDLLDRLERIRGVAAERMGMVGSAAASRQESPAVPILGLVSEAASYEDAQGRAVRAADVDFVSRLLFMQQAHKTHAGTSTVCAGVAARLGGTVVNQCFGAARRDSPDVRIGHPAGVIETEVDVQPGPDGPVVRRATLGRTARRIMEGYVFFEGEAVGL